MSSFYDLSKPEREKRVIHIRSVILKELTAKTYHQTKSYFGDEDTYIRKAAYLSVGIIYFQHTHLQSIIIAQLEVMEQEEDFRIRQTAINAAGEIGKKDFGIVQHLFDKGLFDVHHSPRNAVIGSLKKMGEVNPVPVLAWAKRYLHHPDKEIRREICHGIELRGRKYPQDILPLLQSLQHDKTDRVRSTLVHVLGQISYKKGCLETVIAHLKTWDNTDLVGDAVAEIIDVHDRYHSFADLTTAEARRYIDKHLFAQ